MFYTTQLDLITSYWNFWLIWKSSAIFRQGCQISRIRLWITNFKLYDVFTNRFNQLPKSSRSIHTTRWLTMILTQKPWKGKFVQPLKIRNSSTAFCITIVRIQYLFISYFGWTNCLNYLSLYQALVPLDRVYSVQKIQGPLYVCVYVCVCSSMSKFSVCVSIGIDVC